MYLECTLQNKQDIFDEVLAHLRKQGQKSVFDSKTCAYRNGAGLKCPIGYLIPAGSYSSKIEGTTVQALVEEGTIPYFKKFGGPNLRPWTSFLGEIQLQMHDTLKVVNFKRDLELGAMRIAKLFDLSYSEPA
jgi:hypothetical protein